MEQSCFSVNEEAFAKVLARAYTGTAAIPRTLIQLDTINALCIIFLRVFVLLLGLDNP